VTKHGNYISCLLAVGWLTEILYCRLSRDDGADKERSITNQRQMLKRYAKENVFHVYDEYVDDSFNGTIIKVLDLIVCLKI